MSHFGKQGRGKGELGGRWVFTCSGGGVIIIIIIIIIIVNTRNEGVWVCKGLG